MKKSKIKITTRESYTNTEGVLQEIEIVITAVAVNNVKSVKRMYAIQREFEIEFEALMNKYGLRLDLPF